MLNNIIMNGTIFIAKYMNVGAVAKGSYGASLYIKSHKRLSSPCMSTLLPSIAFRQQQQKEDE